MPFNHILKLFFSKQTLLLLIGITFFVLAGIIHNQSVKPTLVISKQDSAININKDLITFLSAGNKRLFGDLIWVQTLLESDLEQYEKKDLNNWLYLRFLTIQHLDPRFYENYLYGGQFLSIVKDDLEGAEVLYQLAMKHYPTDYALNFHAGFMNYFEKGDFKRALFYLEKIQGHPRAPVFLGSIINKLTFGVNDDLQATWDLVLANYETTKSPYLKQRLAEDLYAIRSEIDLNCLNQKKLNCRDRDLNGKPYINENGIFRSSKLFVPFGIKTRESKKL
jgi:hypothetical protein